MPNVYVIIAQYEALDNYYPPYDNLIGIFATKDEAEKACEEFDKKQREHDDLNNYVGCDVQEFIFGKNTRWHDPIILLKSFQTLFFFSHKVQTI